MSVPCLDIADAVVAALNAVTLSQSVTFERVYVPKFDTENNAAVQGKVVPKTDNREMGSAASDNATVEIDIGVMKRLQDAVADEKAELDGMLELCEEIKAVINRQRLDGATSAICNGTEQAIPFSVELVDDKRTFLAVITATFLTTVAV
jgi:hypothetical protein